MAPQSTLHQASKAVKQKGGKSSFARNAEAVKALGGLPDGFAISVLDASTDCIKLIGLDGTVVFMNRNGQCAMEIDNFDLIAGARWADLWPEDGQDRVAKSVRIAANGNTDRFEAYCPTAKGKPRWWDVSVAPVFGADGRPTNIVSISRDVTERVERERATLERDRELQELALAQARTLEEKERLIREKTLLMQEVDHRVKNSLGMITSLLQLQGRVLEDESARDALSRASNRVQTIASVHERLYRDGSAGELDLAEYIQALCGDLETTMQSDTLHIKVDAKQAGVAQGKEAVTIGLIITELVTNAARHAGDDCDPCTVTISCKPILGGKRELRIEDNGCGLPEGFDPAKSRGLGMRIVLASVQRVDGELRFESDENDGTRFIIRF